MAWKIPLTWTAGMVPGATEFNEEIRDNLNALKTPPWVYTALQSTATAYWGAPSGTWSALPSAAHVAISTYGGDVMVGVRARLLSNSVAFRLKYNGTGVDGDAILGFSTTALADFTTWVTGLASGAYTIVTEVQGIGGVAQLGVSGVPLVVWAREIS